MLVFQSTGTPYLPSSFPALIIFKPSKSECTNTYASTLSLDQRSLLFGNARVFRDPQGLHLTGARPVLHSISLKKKKESSFGARVWKMKRVAETRSPGDSGNEFLQNLKYFAYFVAGNF